MRIDVADVKLEAGSHKRVDLTASIESVELGGQDFLFDRPFAGTAEIWNAGDRLLVKVDLTGEVRLQCSRCLTPFTQPLEISFEEEFVQGQPDQGLTEEDAEDESGRTVSFYQGDEIDLDEPIRENALLELPMKPLCDEDCLGICPTCGANRNEAGCTCETVPESVDPRLAKLKDLLRKPDSNS